MKASAHEGTDNSEQTAQGRKRRFRFTKKQMDDDLDYLEAIAAKVDELQGTHVDEPHHGPADAIQTPAPAPEESPFQLAEAAQARARARVQEAAAAPVTAPPAPAAPVAPVAPTATHSVPVAQNWEQPVAEAPTTPQPSPELQPATPSPSPAGDAVLQPTTPVSALEASLPPLGTSSTGLLGVDVNRILHTLEAEAQTARLRIEQEVRSARDEADEMIHRANADAERIRDHAQQQARVLLGEVEEIISEAQHTGEQILVRADEEAVQIRGQATETLSQSQEEARKIVETARREGEQILAEQRRLATVRAQEALREQDRLKDQIRRLEERRRQVLESLEPLIDQLSQMIPAERNVVQLPTQQQQPQQQR